MRGIALPVRFRLGRRQEATRPAVTERLLAAPAAAPVVKTGERPYAAEIPVSQKTAYQLAYAAKFYVDQPEFHPAPFAAPVTAPMQAVRDNVRVPSPAEVLGAPGPAPASPTRLLRVATTDPAVLAEALEGLRQLDFAAVDAAREVEGATYASVRAASAEPPAPAPSRSAGFVADMRHRGGLPLFRQTAREVGWCGLEAETPWQGWAQWSTEGWARRERELADAALRNARAVVLGGARHAARGAA